MRSKQSNPVGGFLSRARKQAGLSQEALAERIHAPRQTVSNWESGKSLPDIEMLKTLVEVLEVPVERLICEEEPPRWSLLSSPAFWEVWCRRLGLVVLVWGGISGFQAGSGAVQTPEGGVSWGFLWAEALPVWYAALIRGTILLVQDPGPVKQQGAVMKHHGS